MPHGQFDQERVSEVFEALFRVSGLGCTLYGIDQEEMAQVLMSRNACKETCPNSGAGQLWNNQCRRIHALAAISADGMGGRYFYLCPHDRMFFAVPVVEDGILAGGMCVGPLYVTDDMADLLPGFEEVPVVDPEYVQELSTLAASAVRGMARTTLATRPSAAGGKSQGEALAEELRFSTQPHVTEYPIIHEHQLFLAIRRGDTALANQSLTRLIDYLLQTHLANTSFKFQERAIELATMMGRAAIDVGVSGDIAFSMAEQCVKEIRLLSTNAQISSRLQRLSQQMINVVQELQGIEYNDVVYRVTNYIYAHLDERVTLAQAAEEVGLSPSHISRLLKEKTGEGFADYSNRLRIDVSKGDLVSTDDSIAEIAARVGFADAAYYTRVFKKVTGVTPRHFRAHRDK